MAKQKPEPDNELGNENEPEEFMRTPMTRDDLAQRVADKITHKLKEGEEINGVYLGTFSVTTRFGDTEQHQFKVDGTPVFYWSNVSFSASIVDAELNPMDKVRIRRFENNTYVIDKL